MQYTEPLEVEDLEAISWAKYDGTRQYARDKRRQVSSGRSAPCCVVFPARLFCLQGSPTLHVAPR